MPYLPHRLHRPCQVHYNTMSKQQYIREWVHMLLSLHALDHPLAACSLCRSALDTTCLILDSMAQGFMLDIYAYTFFCCIYIQRSLHVCELQLHGSASISYLSKRGSTKIPLLKGTAHRNKKPFGTKIKVNTCTNFVLGRLKNYYLVRPCYACKRAHSCRVREF